MNHTPELIPTSLRLTPEERAWLDAEARKMTATLPARGRPFYGYGRADVIARLIGEAGGPNRR